MAHETFERRVAMVGGLALAASGALLLPEARHGSVGEHPLFAPPFVSGAIAAGVAASSEPRWRRAWLTVNDAVMLAIATVWGVLGLMIWLLPGLFVLAVAIAYAHVTHRGNEDERGARAALATGGLWAFVFGVGHVFTDDPGVVLALAASLGLGLGGLAWLRALERERDERRLPPRAVVN